MKKWLFKLALVAMIVHLYQFKPSGLLWIYHWRQMTKTTILTGRTETILIIQMVEKHNKNYVVVDAKTHNEGDQIEDESNGFTYPHAASENEIHSYSWLRSWRW